MQIQPIGANAAEVPGVATGATARERSEPPLHAVEIDAATQQAVPLRFPWLSRLTQQLERATGQRPPFDAAPELGDRLDRSA